MKHKIKAEHMKHLLEAQAFWKTVDPATVDLRTYRAKEEDRGEPSCGSAACFGGWLPFAPFFKALGVTAHHIDGSPIYRRSGCHYDNLEASEELFCWQLFWPAGQGFRGLGEHLDQPWPGAQLSYSDRAGSDYEIVAYRIQFAIDNSEVV